MSRPHGAETVWRPEQAPDVTKPGSTHNAGRLRGCDYCGSMHPTDLVAAMKAGAVAHWADFKYGWPHKAYVENIPNPHAGMLEVRCWSSSPQAGIDREVREKRFDPTTGEPVADYVTYTEQPKPAGATTYGNFYTVHLMDATPEERQIIERHLGFTFQFSDDGRVTWERALP